jgi:hypothetical protein
MWWLTTCPTGMGVGSEPTWQQLTRTGEWAVARVDPRHVSGGTWPQGRANPRPAPDSCQLRDSRAGSVKGRRSAKPTPKAPLMGSARPGKSRSGSSPTVSDATAGTGRPARPTARCGCTAIAAGRTSGNPRQPTGCSACPSRSGAPAERRAGAELAARAARLRAALKTYRKFAQTLMVQLCYDGSPLRTA